MVAGLSPHYWLPGGLTLISLLVWQLDLFSKRSSQKNKILNYSSTRNTKRTGNFWPDVTNGAMVCRCDSACDWTRMFIPQPWLWPRANAYRSPRRSIGWSDEEWKVDRWPRMMRPGRGWLRDSPRQWANG